MTTISGTTSSLSSLAALYQAENVASASTGTGAGLTSDQVDSLENIVEGEGSTAASNLSTLLGQSTTSPTDLNSIIDAIQAQGTASASDSTSTGSTTTSAATEQQKAAALMTSIYQTQQANLFTLLG
jgi:hypothetical protein